MRYVIAICFVAGFLIWDGWRNDGRYLDTVVGELRRVVDMLGV